jgi:hypothetical protein
MDQRFFSRIRAFIGITLSTILTFALIAQLGPQFPAHAQQNPPARGMNLGGGGTGGAVTSLPSKQKRWALVIGVDQYRDGNISGLRGAANDAGKLSKALVDYAGFPKDQVILLATDQPEERQPTRINILTYLSNLTSAVPKDGLLLVSFAGHGIERGGQAFLIPTDARLTNDISLLEESAISVERMRKPIKASGVSQVVVLLDACRNDPGGRADAPNPLTQSYVRGFNFDVKNREVQAFATLYATAVGERAFEYQEKKQGYFTWAVVEGMKGGAANDKGEVTLAGLIRYVQDVVPKRIAIDLGAGKNQKPFAMIEGYRADDLIIAVSGPPGSNAAASNDSALPASNFNAADTAAIESQYWDTIKNSNDGRDFQDYLKEYPQGRFAQLARLKVRQLEAPANNGNRVNSAPPPVDTSRSNPPVSNPGSRPVGNVSLADIEASFKSNLFDETIRLSSAFMQSAPESKEANAYLGLAYLSKRDVDNAIGPLSKAISLGQPMLFPVKRLREPLFGHALDNVVVTISTAYFAITSGKTIYTFNFGDMTEARLDTYGNQCYIVHVKGTYTETSTGSDKSKRDTKTFNLFPPGSTLVQVQQGNMMVNNAACTPNDNYMSMAVMNLLTRVMSAAK